MQPRNHTATGLASIGGGSNRKVFCIPVELDDEGRRKQDQPDVLGRSRTTDRDTRVAVYPSVSNRSRALFHMDGRYLVHVMVYFNPMYLSSDVTRHTRLQNK